MTIASASPPAADPDAVSRLVADFRRDLDVLYTAIGRRLVGHIDIVEGVVSALLAGGHVLLEGVPGLGKTLLVRTLGEALELSFSRVQFTPDLMPSDLTGHAVLEPASDGGIGTLRL
ncbi:MAG TPA: AAA family ATPase, partial [Polyangia bacterium]